MKPFLTILLLLCIAPAFAQEQMPPSVIPGAASEFLRDFQNAVQYLANKKIPPKQRENFAKSFATQFAKDAVIQVLNGTQTTSLTPAAYFMRLIDLKYDKVEIEFTVNKQSAFKKNDDGWWTTQYELTQSFKGMRDGKRVAEDFTIKTIDLFFLYTASTKSWTKKYGHVLAHSVVKVPLKAQKTKRQ